LILIARKWTLAAGEDPEDNVKHPEGEGKDSIADELGHHKKNQRNT
jgi:hypothetical protein